MYPRATRAGVALFCSATSLAQDTTILYVIDRSNDSVVVLQANEEAITNPDSAYLGIFGETEGNLSIPQDLAFHPVTGNLFVSEVGNGGDVREFGAETGTYLGSFGETEAELVLVRGIAFHPVTSNLLVADQGGAGSIKEFDGITGEFLDHVGDTETTTQFPLEIAFHPITGNMFVLERRRVYEFNGETGDSLGEFGETGQHLSSGIDLDFEGNGNLVVTDSSDNQVEVFEGTTGAFLTSFGSLVMSDPSGIATGSIFISDGPLIWWYECQGAKGPSQGGGEVSCESKGTINPRPPKGTEESKWAKMVVKLLLGQGELVVIPKEGDYIAVNQEATAFLELRGDYLVRNKGPGPVRWSASGEGKKGFIFLSRDSLPFAQGIPIHVLPDETATKLVNYKIDPLTLFLDLGRNEFGRIRFKDLSKPEDHLRRVGVVRSKEATLFYPDKWAPAWSCPMDSWPWCRRPCRISTPA